MSTRDTPWPTGTPCWVDYGAPDVDAAGAFYADVLGWSLQASGPEHGGYVMAQVAGRDAAGIGPATPGMPPAWVTYLASDDVDATAAAARVAGGTVLAEPFDVADLGRMAVLADSQGAVLGVWQAGRHIGCQVVNEPGAVTWNEAAHADPEQGREFYAAVFGLTFDALPGQEGYHTFSTGDHPLGGMGGLPSVDAAPHWLTYFAVADTDAAVATARRRGATVTAPPFDTEFGRIATVTDPWGAVFAVMGGGTAA